MGGPAAEAIAGVPLLIQAACRPVFRGTGKGEDVVCASCHDSVLLENVSPEAVFDVRIRCAKCSAINETPPYPRGRGLGLVMRRVVDDHSFAGTFVLDMDEVVVGERAIHQRAREIGEDGSEAEPIEMSVAGVKRVVAEARSTFASILGIIEPRARRQQAPKHRLPRLLHLLEDVTEISSPDEMTRVLRWSMHLQRATSAFRRWSNDPVGSQLIGESKAATDFDHNMALLEVATIFNYARLGPELVPRRVGEQSPDLMLRISATHVIEVEAKTPRTLQFPAGEPIPIHDTPSRDTIRKALDESRGQFTTDGIVAIAGDFWVGGIDEYAAAATELLSAPLPSDASESAREHYARLLGVLFVSLGYEKVGSRSFRSRLFLRWVPNPRYSGSIRFRWQPDSDGRMTINLRPPASDGTSDGVEPEESDDFERYEQDAAFNPARFRLLGDDEVDVEGLIGNKGELAFTERLAVWTFPVRFRPASPTDLDVACKRGFTVVTVLPDGTFLADPSVGWIDLHGVRFKAA